jgi:hypothetical protein
MTTISKVGLDVGFGDTKADLLRPDNGLDSVSFPSILGNAQQLTTISAGLSTAARDRGGRRGQGSAGERGTARGEVRGECGGGGGGEGGGRGEENGGEGQ